MGNRVSKPAVKKAAKKAPTKKAADKAMLPPGEQPAEGIVAPSTPQPEMVAPGEQVDAALATPNDAKVPEMVPPPEQAPGGLATPNHGGKAKVNLDYETLVSEYGRNLADQMMAEAKGGDKTETRPAKGDAETR